MKELVSEFINSYDLSTNQKDILIGILNKHYRTRNEFFHDAKFEFSGSKIDKMLKRLGKKEFNIHEEIKHADASLNGFHVINAFIRIELIMRLNSSST